MERRWVRVTRRHRCPVCGKPDYCSVSGDVVHCMRVESTWPSKGELGGWLHRLSEPAPVAERRLPERPKPELDWSAIAQSMFESPTAAEERQFLALTLGVKESALVELQVGRGWDEYRGVPYSSWPERDAGGKVVGIVRRYRSGAKKTMRWSSHGLYFAAPLIRMKLGPVFMPEGGSDTAAMLGLGLNVIGRPSNLGGIGQLAELLKPLSKRNKLVVIGEMDRRAAACGATCRGCGLCWPGLFGARETAKRLQREVNRRVVWIIPDAKDVRAWLQGREVTGPKFLQEARLWA